MTTQRDHPHPSRNQVAPCGARHLAGRHRQDGTSTRDARRGNRAHSRTSGRARRFSPPTGCSGACGCRRQNRASLPGLRPSRCTESVHRGSPARHRKWAFDARHCPFGSRALRPQFCDQGGTHSVHPQHRTPTAPEASRPRLGRRPPRNATGWPILALEAESALVGRASAALRRWASFRFVRPTGGS
jgi:hypothetical protein